MTDLDKGLLYAIADLTYAQRNHSRAVKEETATDRRSAAGLKAAKEEGDRQRAAATRARHDAYETWSVAQDSYVAALEALRRELLEKSP